MLKLSTLLAGYRITGCLAGGFLHGDECPGKAGALNDSQCQEEEDGQDQGEFDQTLASRFAFRRNNLLLSRTVFEIWQ